MIYVMSDIHGCYEKYQKMLKKISFGKNDLLYILGDVVDRGTEGMKVVLDIADRENVILLRGNHDHQAVILLSNLYRLEEKNCPKELMEVYKGWILDGGDKTLLEFLKLSEDEREKVLLTLSKTEFFKEIDLNGKRYLLAHTVPEQERLEDYPNWELYDYIMGEPDYEKVYFEDKYIVTGHTPTGLIEKKSNGKIWMKNNHIAIDCGAAFGNNLGCLCLDTLEEFYCSYKGDNNTGIFPKKHKKNCIK